MEKEKTKKIVGTGLLLALEIVFGLIGNNIAIGPVSINLSLIPIAVGAIFYGPFIGAFLGLINGILSFFAVSTQEIFVPITPVGTVLVCLIKTTLAGFISGIVYGLFRMKNKKFGIIFSSLLVPIINTGVFIVACFTVFRPFIDAFPETFKNAYTYLFLGVLGWNFIFEFAVSSLLSPSVCYLVKIYDSRNNANI